MVRSFLLTFTMLLLGVLGVSAQTILTGKVKDGDTKEDLIGASVKVSNGATFVKGGVTNIDGEYRLQLNPGTYTVEISYTGYQTQRTEGVQVLTGQINFFDATLGSGTLINEVVIKEYKVPLIKKDETSGGQTLTSESLKNLPTRNVNAIVATTAGTTSIDGGGVNIKGSRSNATNIYVDGIRISGSAVPVQDIEQLQVITSGIGAEYGDVTGGIVSIVTKGPASKFSGGVDVENSHGLDPYGYLLANANVSGPILLRKAADGSQRSVIGFRLSGQYWSQDDDDPPALAVAHAKKSVLDNLYAHPLSLVNGNIIPSAEKLTNDSVDFLKARPFEGRKDINLTGKLDFRLTENLDLSFTGTFLDTKNQTTPTGTGGWTDNNWLLLNSQNNPTEYDQTTRGIVRLRHRLGSENSAKDAASSKRISFSNAYYQLQFGFERSNEKREDARHKDKFFDYGYIGRFNYDFLPVGGPTLQADGQVKFQQVDTRPIFTGYQAGYELNGQTVVPNQGLANYNEFSNPELASAFIAQNGQFRSVFGSIWSDMHRGISAVYNRYSKKQNDIATLNASFGADLRLGNSGTHNIQVGLLNEQRKTSEYVLAPNSLWLLGDQKSNAHINGLDTTRIKGQYYDPIFSPFVGSDLNYFYNQVTTPTDQTFYKNVRAIDGTPIDEYININKFRPDQMNLAMFSSQELTNQNILSYYGYDYLGNKLQNGVTFNDFFTAKNADGVRTFPVAAQQPVYQAAFIKDKFTFKDIIFSLGLRAERFDLNTKVMKDPYSLYEVMSAKEFHQTVTSASRPSNVGDDFKVYVNSKSDPAIKAYRDGNIWYDKKGVQQNDGNLIFGSGVVEPFLKDTIYGDDIASPNFNVNSAFQDYKPQWLFLPRLAFSFPISDNANFFAHYDILAQRPPSNWEVSPLNYLYFNTASRTPENNANLRPERVVDYEVGFQQKLNSNSALKFSAYYREMRDMIQLRTLLYIPTLGNRTTFDNIDFGTTKGFTVQYDLRRIQNFEMRLAYTLQFAEGTGSDPEAQRGLTRFGNIRTLFPLSFDERHNIAGILDYRFSEGKAYNGPRVNGKDILSNFGVNFQVTNASGRPYTAKEIPERFGAKGTLASLNGSRLPWRTNVDMRIDKSIDLNKNLSLNVYFRVANLLDRRNLVGVYQFTGSPTDDGYLASAQGKSIVDGVAAQGKNVQAFLNSYSWTLQNPNNFTQPRRMYVGASLNF